MTDEDFFRWRSGSVDDFSVDYDVVLFVAYERKNQWMSIYTDILDKRYLENLIRKREGETLILWRYIEKDGEFPVDSGSGSRCIPESAWEKLGLDMDTLDIDD